MPLLNLPTCIKNLLLILLLNFTFQSISAQQQLAFPSAYGAGAYVSGGRGQTVYHVTTTDFNDSQGSFKWAFEQAVANKGGTIVFDVSGVITIQPGGSGRYRVEGDVDADDKILTNISILGQTAPFPGITIDTSVTYWEPVGIHNIIFRYIKFRGNGTRAFMSMASSDEIIMDHCSFAWSSTNVTSLNLGTFTDFNIDGNDYTPTDITLQNSFMAHCGRASNTGNTSNNVNAKFGEVSIIRNVYHEMSYRTPIKTGGNGNYDIINNIVSKARSGKRQMRFDNQPFKLNHIGNDYTPSVSNIIEGPINDGHKIWTTDTSINVEIYNDDNAYGWSMTPDSGTTGDSEKDAWDAFRPSGFENAPDIPSSWFVNSAHPLNGLPIPILSRTNLAINLLPEVGANKYIDNNAIVVPYRDAIDTRYINDIVNNINRSLENIPANRVGIDIDQTSNSRPNNFYNSNDHIPEAYLVSRGITGNATIHNQVQPSGYTLLEEYANQVDGPPSISIGVESVSVTPSTAELEITETIDLTAIITPTNATNQNGIWSSSDESIATVDSNGVVTAVSEGVVIIRFTTNDGGFFDTSEITVFPEALLASAGDDQQICIGESTTLTASGGTNYVWSTGETTASIEVTPNDTTIYSVTVSDDNGQSEEASVTVIVNPLPIANAGEDQNICEGELISLTATGGDSYLWSTGETTESIEVNPIIETTYDVEVISNNCSSTDSVTVYVNDAPDITISEDIVIVEGNSTTLTASGGDTYEWSTGEITESISVSPIVTTQYTVSSLGPNGCSGYAEVNVTVIPEIIAEAGDDVTICSGDTITLIASGGLSYTWDTGDTGAELTVNPTITTTYTVTAEDGYGYTASDSVTVTVNEVPEITVNDEIYIMIGNSVTINADGGDSYLWSTSETTASITVNPIVTTTYTVTGFSANGCETTLDVLVTVIEVLNANAGNDVSICLGESIALNASGGITYTWNTGAIGHAPIVSPLETTTYTVTVTDGFGNSDSDDVTVTVNPVPTATASEDQVICNGESATLTAEGGDSYLWSTGDTTATITVSPETDTTYTVEVFSNNCSDIDEVTVTVLPTPDLAISDDVVLITGNTTTLVVTGGDSYVWNTGDTTNTLEVSPTETTLYTVTAFSNNGCQSNAQVTVTVIPEVIANAGNDVAICNGASVTLNASGGVEYTWNTGGTGPSPSFSPNITTTYTVTVSDEYGNTDSDSVTITVNELPIVTVSDDITINNGDNTTLIANGAETYLWNTGESSSSINVAPTETTTYIVTGLSANGCQSEEEVTVTVIPELVADAGNDITICSGESVSLNATGGITYTWNTGDTGGSPTFSPTATTSYTVTVTDAYGNTDSDSVTVTVNESPDVTISDSITIIEGESTNLIASGAETYLWNNGNTTNSITVSPSQTTTYTVIGTTNSCSVEVQVTVTVEGLFAASAGADESVCDNETYEIVLTANQGDSYLWNTGETTQSIVVSPLSTSTYSVTITQGEQVDTDDVTVYVDPSPEVVIANGDSIEILNGDFVTLSASGANSYEWNNGAIQPNIAVSPSVTTVYEVKGYIGNCYDEKQVTVNVLQPVVADAGEDVFMCLDDVVTLTATGGDEYVWSTGDITQSIEVSPNETTDYTVTVFNALDFDEDTVTVEVDLNCGAEAIVPIDDDSVFSFDIYPNPANDIVNVKISGGALIISYVHIYDLTGKLIHSTKIANEDINPSTTRQIDISTLRTGVYFIKLIDMNREVTKKLIVK